MAGWRYAEGLELMWAAGLELAMVCCTARVAAGLVRGCKARV